MDIFNGKIFCIPCYYYFYIKRKVMNKKCLPELILNRKKHNGKFPLGEAGAGRLIFQNLKPLHISSLRI